MTRINLHVTPDFERELEALMHGKKLASRSEAIRYAVHEAAVPYLTAPRDLSVLEGLIERSTGLDDEKRRPMADLECELDTDMARALREPQTPSVTCRAPFPEARS